jgi:hypothetical protein
MSHCLGNSGTLQKAREDVDDDFDNDDVDKDNEMLACWFLFL